MSLHSSNEIDQRKEPRLREEMVLGMNENYLVSIIAFFQEALSHFKLNTSFELAWENNWKHYKEKVSNKEKLNWLM